MGGRGCAGIALGCPRHDLHMEELGTTQLSPHLPTYLLALEGVMPTAYSTYFGDLRGSKGSAERQTCRRGWHLRQPTSIFSLPFMLKNNPWECTGCLTLGALQSVQVCFCQFSNFYHSFTVFALSLKCSSESQVLSINFMLKFPVQSYKGITTHSLNSSEELTISWKIFSVLISCDR